MAKNLSVILSENKRDRNEELLKQSKDEQTSKLKENRCLRGL